MNISEIYKTDHGDLSGLTLLLLTKEEDREVWTSLVDDCKEKYITFHATSVDEATDIISREYVDIVIFDISHTGSSSLDSLIEPALDLNKPYALIALADEKDEILARDVLKKGAEDYLLKSNTDARLLAKSIRQSIKCLHLRYRNINLALIDNITGLLSRRGFMMLAEQELKVALRYKRTMFLIFAEVAEIAARRERMGEPGFEKVLRETSTLLRHSFRGADIISSFGDGTFSGLAVGASIDSSSTIDARIRENLKRFNSEDILGFKLSLITAIIIFDPEYPLSIEEMFLEADKTMKEKR